MDMNEDKREVVVVTGAASGIGRATAAKFVAAGARVALLDVDEAALAESMSRLPNAECAYTVVVDLSDREETRHAFERVACEFGEVSILVNNVGGSAREDASQFWESKPETWDRIINLNLFSALNCTHQVLGAMRARGRGKIVSVSSDTAIQGMANVADYSAAKAGILGWTRAVAKEMASHGINVNAVCPGLTRTQGPLRLRGEAGMAESEAKIPLGFAAEPEDIANAIFFLASPEARSITGQFLAVNGGRW
jgi:acetoacetyl-CoA reductase/3-oxoacyl-[acyl-carrier protein] reductase